MTPNLGWRPCLGLPTVLKAACGKFREKKFRPYFQYSEGIGSKKKFGVNPTTTSRDIPTVKGYRY